MTAFESPELLALYDAYTAGPRSIGASLTAANAREDADRPLIVATHADIALFPGRGAAPVIESFRLGAKGFRELAAVSHLGPAVSTLARLRELGADWEDHLDVLNATCQSARAANSAALWAEKLQVDAFAGREAAIAAMVDYTCRRTEAVLERAKADPGFLTTENVRRHFLDGPDDDLPVPVNRVMIATFFLSGLDTSHRLIRWFEAREVSWESAMVIVAGKQGRPTAGVTIDSNSVARVIQTVSQGRLPLRHLLIAPHAPVFPQFDGADLSAAAGLEDDYRRLWSSVLATCDLGALMFAGYPGFEPAKPGGTAPRITAPDDWTALTTRLRLVLEDPRQLLSGAVTDYAAQQLVAAGNDPSRVVVPGLDGEPYP
ncbi:MAG: hypothetical protein JWO46_1252 [Nocardioidaceae bacterium]|nr:hypothetical protein [Nocardioidaceae bacterium]